MRTTRLVAWLGGGLLMLASCGGSTDGDDGSGARGGSSGTAGSGGVSGSAGSSGNAGSAGSGGSSGASGSGGSAGTAGSGGSTCEASSDCVLLPASCCGQCGAATREDSIALNSEDADAHRQDVCGPNVGCTPCYEPTDPNLIAACDGGACVVIDLLTTDITSCSSASDCRLRTHDCCECGGDQSEEGLVAIGPGGEQGLVALVCDDPQPCPLCEPLPPMNATADCREGKCVVVWTNQ